MLRLSTIPTTVTYPLVVNNLEDGGELSSIWSSAEQDHAADFYKSPLAGCDVGVAHCDVLW